MLKVCRSLILNNEWPGLVLLYPHIGHGPATALDHARVLGAPDVNHTQQSRLAKPLSPRRAPDFGFNYPRTDPSIWRANGLSPPDLDRPTLIPPLMGGLCLPLRSSQSHILWRASHETSLTAHVNSWTPIDCDPFFLLAWFAHLSHAPNRTLPYRSLLPLPIPRLALPPPPSPPL